MAFDFPASPSVGSTYVVGGITYVWDGTAWNASGPISKTAQIRNRVCNPTAQISQENGTNAVGNGGYPADQWVLSFVSSSTITGQKSGNSIIITASPAETSAAAGEYAEILQRIEGNDLADFALGTAQSGQFVIAFSVNAAVAGTYWVAFGNISGTHSWLGSYTISASEAGTWVRKSVIVPAGAINAGTWPIDNTAGAVVHFTFHCGSTFTGIAGFQTGNFRAGPGQALGLSTAAACAITNVGLYLDPDLTGVAPPFQMPDFADELARCKRYWQKVFTMFSGNVNSGSAYYGWTAVPVEPRTAAPTMSGIASGQAGFPAAVGTLSMPFGAALYEARIANATVAAVFDSVITINARM